MAGAEALKDDAMKSRRTCTDALWEVLREADFLSP